MSGPISRVRILAALLLISTAPSEAFAQDTAPEGDPIIVTKYLETLGISPERTLNDDDVSGYGLATVGELLDEVTAENGETREDPVFLVNGRRIADLSGVEEFPAEAIDEIEILPPGSGTRIGASANRRVYNVKLKRKVRTLAARASVRAATEGDWTGRRADITATDIRRQRRINLMARVRSEDDLREADRDILQPLDSPDDLGRFRTLRPSIDGYDLNLTAANRLADWLDGSISAKLRRDKRHSLLGLGPTNDALDQRSRSFSGSYNLSLNADVGQWLIGFIGTHDQERRRILTDRLDDLAPPGVSLSKTVGRTRTSNAQIIASGPVAELPAGPLRLNLGANMGRDSIESRRSFAGTNLSDGYKQWSRGVSAGIEVPIANPAKDVLPALGEFTASVEFSRTRVSNLGTLSNRTFALTWQPAGWVRLFGSVTAGRTPPAVGFIADPILETPGIRYFDPLRDETVDVVEISGGNPDIGSQRDANRRLNVNLKPIRSLPLQITAEYQKIRNRDIVTALPPASELILLAFPERFIRDPGGVLTAVDIRPVTFARQSEEQLRWGFNLNVPLSGNNGGSETPVDNGANDSGDVPRIGKLPRRANNSGRRPWLQLNASHTWLLDSKLVIRSGIDPIDLLSRGAIGLGGATRPRHQFDFTIGYAERGLGVRLIGQRRGTSYLNLVSGDTTDVLRFAPLTTLNLRAFAEGQRLMPSAEWLKRARLSLSILNLTNARQKIRNDAGVTPLAYQPAYRYPLGRTVQIEIRKVF